MDEHERFDEDVLFNLSNRLVSDMHTYLGENICIAGHVYMREILKSGLWHWDRLESTVAIVKGSKITWMIASVSN